MNVTKKKVHGGGERKGGERKKGGGWRWGGEERQKKRVKYCNKDSKFTYFNIWSNLGIEYTLSSLSRCFVD